MNVFQGKDNVPVNPTRKEPWRTLLDSMAWIAIRKVVTLGRYQTILPALCLDWGKPTGRTWSDAMDCATRYLTHDMATLPPSPPPLPTTAIPPATKAARDLLAKCIQNEPARDRFAITVPRAARMLAVKPDKLARFMWDPITTFTGVEAWLAEHAQWSPQRFAALYMHFMLCDGPLDLVRLLSCSRLTAASDSQEFARLGPHHARRALRLHERRLEEDPV